MSQDKHEATKKADIEMVTLTVTVTANKVNENGTFSGITIKEVKGVKGLKAVSHPRSGGAIYFQIAKEDVDKGAIKLLTSGEASAQKKVKPKLF